MEQQKNNPEAGISEMEISSFWEDLKKYDKDHESANWAAAFLPEDEGVQEALRKEEESKIKIKDLLEKHGAFLDKIGFKLESPNKKEDSNENEAKAIGEMKVHLESASKYISFLKLINTGAVSENQGGFIHTITGKFLTQIRKEYTLENTEVDDRLLEFISGLKEMNAEYERLGLYKDTIEFKNYIPICIE